LATYAAADGSELPMLVFEPANGTPPTAGVVMFHGGALRKGSADDLAPHCRQLAGRGFFAVSAGYRLLGQGAVCIDDCIADVRRAVDQFSRSAALRGLGPSRLASGGSSAGAHLALLAAMTAPDGLVPATGPGVAGVTGVAGVAAVTGVAAVAALNPVVDLLAYPAGQRQVLEQGSGIPPGRLADYSPAEFVRLGNPPVLIQHGTQDEVAPVDHVRRFRDAMTRAGNDCILLEYAGAAHAFHYPGPGGHFEDVIDATAEFLLDRLTDGAGPHHPHHQAQHFPIEHDHEDL
jgi:acetyl esterase/lipase